jgi:hypothetical protein
VAQGGGEMSLPKWIKAMKGKKYQHRNGFEIFKDLELTHKAFSIAWDALAKIKAQSRENEFAGGEEILCEEAMGNL